MFATTKEWPVALPSCAVGGAVAATALIGALAGLYPAMRAASLSPTEAIATA